MKWTRVLHFCCTNFRWTAETLFKKKKKEPGTWTSFSFSQSCVCLTLGWHLSTSEVFWWHCSSVWAGEPVQKQPEGKQHCRSYYNCWICGTTTTVCTTVCTAFYITVCTAVLLPDASFLSVFQVQVLIIFQPSDISLDTREILSLLQLSTYDTH